MEKEQGTGAGGKATSPLLQPEPEELRINVCDPPSQAGEWPVPFLKEPYNWVSVGPTPGGKEPGYMEAQITCREPLVENTPKS